MVAAPLWAVTAPAAAQVAPPPNSTMWTSIGPAPTVWPPGFAYPETSGAIRAIVVDPSGIIYIGAGGGGVWKRVGGAWTPLTDVQPSLDIGSLAIDPSRPATLYAGTGEMSAIPRYYGIGILKSTDAGATWTHIVGPFLNVAENVSDASHGQTGAGARILSLAVSPADPNVLLAGVQLRINSAVESGVFRSADGGQRWTQVLAGDLGTDVMFDASDGSIAYAVLSSDQAATAKGIYKSLDGGQMWTRLTGASGATLPTTDLGMIRLAISRSSPRTLYAGIENAAMLGHVLGVYKTTDGGDHWVQLTSAPDYCTNFCNDFGRITVHPTNPDIVLFGGSVFHQVYRTLDGGTTWADISGSAPSSLHPDVSAFAFSPDGNTAFVATDGGIASSTTFTAGSVSWIPMNDNLAITQFYGGFGMDPSRGDFLLAGTQDNGNMLFNGSLVWPSVQPGEGGQIGYDPATNTMYRAGETYPAPDTRGGFVESMVGFPRTERMSFSRGPLAVNPRDPATQYLGAERVYQTRNRQLLWTPISPSIVGPSSYITAIAIAEHDPNYVCAGTSDGRVWCTADADRGTASTWLDRSRGLPPRYVMQIAINRFKEYSMAVAFSGLSNVGGDTQGHVFYSAADTATWGSRTVDQWTDISGNLPNTPANTIVIDATDTHETMFVGTDAGVFRTLDRGVTWAPLATELPRAPVTGLALHESSRALFAGTFGRSMWRLLVPHVTSAPGPTITMNPWRVRFSAAAGGPNPPPQALAVINAGSPLFGTTTLRWTASASTAFGGSWLAATPGSGTDNGAVYVAVDVTGLPAGQYNGIVRIASTGATNTPQDLLVLLDVTGAGSGSSGGSAKLSRMTVDLLAGAGDRTEHVGEIYYRGASMPIARAALGIRLGSAGTIRPVVLFDRSTVAFTGDLTTICEPAPNGTCRKGFPHVAGYSAGLGVRGAFGSVAQLTIAAGIGQVGDRSRHVEADLAARFAAHLAAVVGVRQVYFDRDGHHLWWRPITAGIRLQ